jgi:phosphatidate cytidylyltransferase
VSELTKRTLFALAAVPVALGIVYLGGPLLAALLSVMAGIGAWELYRMSRARGIEPLDWAGIPLAAAIPWIVLATLEGRLELPPSFAAVAALAVLAAAIWARGTEGRPIAVVAVTLFGVMYTGVMLSFGLALRYHEYADPSGVAPASGTALVLLPMLLTWASDTGAYFFGRLFGRHKLIRAVSPGKTVEGAVGGLVLSIVVCWAYVRWVLAPWGHLALGPAGIVLFGALVSIAAQLGDLAESLLKRDAGVKDSSGIIPGHGGILDRFDSLLFVLPVAAMAFEWRLLIPVPGQ